ncbi:ATP-binding protein [Kiloniella sp. EL199]|uniref:ATP-binding protein n=1 Tax=Kiloniella sp. EL199 TaxID=2107581 RepID=UPI0013C4A2F6|nr:ATP-binding protein [Kiloniella sp. EL199]
MSSSESPASQGPVGFFSALHSPLCRKISFMIFLSIIIIEIIILCFSYASQKEKLFADLEHTGYVAITSAFSSEHHLMGVEDITNPRSIFGMHEIIGVIIQNNGKEVISVGQIPTTSSLQLLPNEVYRKISENTSSYDVGWGLSVDNHDHQQNIYIRMDTGSITNQLEAYVLRVSGLVLLISFFVTIVTVSVLWLYILRPILSLQNLCVDPYGLGLPGNLDAKQLQRQDEMGDLFRAFKSMTLDMQQAAKASQHVQNLLEEQIAKRTSELEKVNQELHQQIQTTQQSESRFKMFAQSSADWYWEMDTDLRFSFFSNRFSKVTGVNPEQLIGKTREETGVPGITEDQWEKHLACLANHESFREFIHTRTKPDGETVWLSINGEATFDDEGNFLGYQGTGLDITERQKTAQLTEKASKAKSEFLSSMSHELRTPLNSIIGFSQLLEEDDHTPLNDEQKLCITNITKAGRYLLELINQILDLSKIEAGYATFNLEYFYPKEVFRECFEMFREQAGKRLITMKDIQESDKSVYLDRFRFKQIIINFISNAIKYAPEGSKIIFGCQNLPDDKIYIYVSDTGPGIPKHMTAKLFTPFERLHHKGSEVEGTGIGLAISKKLAQEMGGTIGYRNDSEQSSTFWVQFPGFYKK